MTGFSISNIINILKKLKSLASLYIDDGYITTVIGDNLKHIKQITFGNSRIKDSSVFLFRDLLFTKSLTFNRIQLDYLIENTFFKCLSLMELNFNDSSITQIRKYAFQNVPLVKHLSLSNINLKDIDSIAFVGLTNLMSLNLSNNYIKQINHLTFTNMIRLRVLDLSKNYIVLIFRSSFNQMHVVHVDHVNQCCYVKHLCKLNHPIEYNKRCGSLLVSTGLEILVFLHVGLSVILNSNVLIFYIRVNTYVLLLWLNIIHLLSINYHITIITKHAMYTDQFPLIMLQWTPTLCVGSTLVFYFLFW